MFPGAIRTNPRLILPKPSKCSGITPPKGSDNGNVRRIRSRKAGISLVEVVTATVCVGVLGVATVGGTTAASARLDESLLTKQGASAIQNELESLKAAGRMATLTPGLTTKDVSLGPNSTGSMTIDVRGDVPPQLAAYPLESLDGVVGSISAMDISEARIMILRCFGNNDLTQRWTSRKLNAESSFDLYFAEPLTDQNGGADLVPEVLISAGVGNGKITLQALDDSGQLLGNSILLSSGFTETTPRGFLSNGRNATVVAEIFGLDLSRDFNVTRIAGVRVTVPSQETSFKIMGFDGQDIRATVAPTYEVSGPGTVTKTAGALMLNGLKFGSEASSRFVYPARVENLNLNASNGDMRFLNRASTVYDVLIKLDFEARTIVGPKTRTVAVESAVQYGSVYF